MSALIMAARPELLAAAEAAAEAATVELLAALAAGPGASCCAGCGCVRVLDTPVGPVCALCGGASGPSGTKPQGRQSCLCSGDSQTGEDIDVNPDCPEHGKHAPPLPPWTGGDPY